MTSGCHLGGGTWAAGAVPKDSPLGCQLHATGATSLTLSRWVLGRKLVNVQVGSPPAPPCAAVAALGEMRLDLDWLDVLSWAGALGTGD